MPKRGGSLNLPTISWPSSFPQPAINGLPKPLANGGLYGAPQSTGPWASVPFPASPYAFSAESARINNNQELLYHQRPTVELATPISQNHWSVYGPKGGSKMRRRQQRKTRRKNKCRSYRNHNRKRVLFRQ
jgi:hypothetical protein